MLPFSTKMVAAFAVALLTTALAVSQTVAPASTPRNTLADYDPGLVKKIHAFGPLFSDAISRKNTETAAPHDFVEDLQVPDGTKVRVLVKAPAPANPAKILKLAPIAPAQTPNDYFATAITQAISGGYAQVVFPKATYNFVAPTHAGASHVLIKGANDLIIDGQDSTLNFASPLSGGVSIANSQRLVFKRFNLDWPKTLMASIGTIVSINNKANTLRVRIAPQYHVESSTQIIALTPWDAKSDPANPHFSLTSFYKEQYTNNTGTRFVGNQTFEIPYYNHFIQVGDVFLVRHFGAAPWMSAISVGGHDIDFEQVNVYASPLMGFSISGGNGYRLSHCSVTRLSAARLISSAADAVHAADTVGDIIIEDSTFAYQGDDGLNIHGAIGGTAKAGQNFLHWTVGGEGSWAPYGWAKEDPIGWFDNVLGFHGTTPFQSVSHAPSGLQINLKDKAPPGTTRVSDLSHVGARFVIRNNKYLYNRARGILLQSSFGLLENNTFIGQTLHGLILGVAPDSEGPGVQNVIVRGNHFSNVGSIPQIQPLPDPDAAYGAMMISVQGDANNVTSQVPVHANLVLDSNTFTNLRGPGLFITRANDVVVVNNQFTNTNLSRLPFVNLGIANLGGSIVIDHAHNIFLSNNTMKDATTGPISIDSKSTDGIKR
ncbi:right-handed parallel beta-helix repeat-containing protein [Tunturiibacter gelidoferens]|uniref:Right-handed parallel beta-helix repeat-containing protein n=1 Tax=Tunturiibacter gelidiferens TaxID=3069689 RepID=A0AAU7YVG6_9BACT